MAQPGETKEEGEKGRKIRREENKKGRRRKTKKKKVTEKEQKLRSSFWRVISTSIEPIFGYVVLMYDMYVFVEHY